MNRPPKTNPPSELKDQWQESVVGDDEKPTAENSEQPLTV
jgi:hypothetical protein